MHMGAYEVMQALCDQVDADVLVGMLTSQHAISQAEALLIVRAARSEDVAFGWLAERGDLRAAIDSVWRVCPPGSTPSMLAIRMCQSIVCESYYSSRYLALTSELMRLQSVVCQEDSCLIDEVLSK